MNLSHEPLQVRQMRLHHAADEDRAWLLSTLDRIYRPYGVRIEPAHDGAFALRADA